MIDLRLNKSRLSAHFHYYGARYAVFLLIALAVTSLLFTRFRPVTPYEQRVDIMVFSDSVNLNATEAWEAAILSALPPDQKEVNIDVTGASAAGQGMDVAQLMLAKLAAHEGTIWILPAAYFQSVGNYDAFVDLGGEIGSFSVPKGTNLEAGKVIVGKDEEHPGEERLCGIPLDNCQGLNKLLTTSGMVLALPIYADGNYANAKFVANWLLTNADGVPPLPTASAK